MKKIVWLLFAALICIIFSACNGDDGGISGTWEGRVQTDNKNGDEYIEIFVFSGKSFTLTQYVSEVNHNYKPRDADAPAVAAAADDYHGDGSVWIYGK